MLLRKIAALALLLSSLNGLHAQTPQPVQQQISDGILEGVVSADGQVRTFKGIPYAQPPVGSLRWKPPQPVTPWTGVRKAVEFGPRPMQGRIFSDMIFHDAGPSEDCLYLNVWVPEGQQKKKLPVMVWIFGGGFAAGATSEPRQDGGNLSKKGVVVVSMNYRLGVFGFMAHPDLTKESEHQTSGNYGLMDQIAALEWVKRNIAAFGGDPDNVTIFGESAGSFAVSALMASPKAKGLFHRAIGESGAFFSTTLTLTGRAEGENVGVNFGKEAFGSSSIESLRAKSAQEILDAALKQPRRWFSPIIDGYVLPADSRKIYGAGEQAHVPLLAGWNRDEGGQQALFDKLEPTLANYKSQAAVKFGARAEDFMRAYAATNDAEAKRAARDLGGDNFIGFSTWKWLELHRQTGGSPVYRYLFEETLPLEKDAKPGTEPAAPHASEIEYVFRMLPSRDLPWTKEHHEVSELMASYWSNFAKTGNPNGAGLPEWPEYKPESYSVMHLKGGAAAAPDSHRARYLFLDQQK